MRFAVWALALGAMSCGATESPKIESKGVNAPSPVGRPGVDWPAFLGPTADSKSPEVGLPNGWPEEGPRILWTRKLGEGYAPPAVAEGKLYEVSRYRNVNRLSCVDSKTGVELWTYDSPTQYVDRYGYDGGPRCCPVVDGDRVYVLGAEGVLACVATADGKRIWSVDLMEKFGVVQNFFGVGGAPVVDGEKLYVAVGGSPPEADRGDFAEIKANGSAIVAFDKRKGTVIWKSGDELASYAGPALATIGGRRWLFAFARGGLLGMNPIDGAVDFHYPWRARILESVNASNPVVVGDQVFISETYGPGSSLLKIRPGGFDVVWADKASSRAKAMQTHWNTAIYHEGYLYGSSGRHTQNAELRCIEWGTGKVRWRQPDLTRCSLLYVDKHFVCQGEDGALYLLKVDPNQYALVAKATLRDERGQKLLRYPAWAAPVLSHGLMYVRGEGRLVCVELIPPKN